MPVRSVCQNDFAKTNTPRMTRRDSSASSRRDSSTSSKRNMRIDLRNVNNLPAEKTPIRNVVKNDSLSAFLKYEQETENKTPDIPLTAKDLKDQSNTLSKQNSSKELSIEKLSTPKKEISLHSIRLEPIEKPSEELPTPDKTSDFIDPRLINICDNLPINVTKLSDTDNSSDCSNNSVKARPQVINKRNSTDGKNFRKRKILLNRNQFLFDASPVPENLDLTSIESETDEMLISPKTPQLDNFDVHEFLSSFNSDERDSPLFRDCKDFLSSHLNNNTFSTSNDSPLIRGQNEPVNNAKERNEISEYEYRIEDQEKGEIFICIETDHSENDLEHPAKDNPLADNPTTQVLDDIADNKFFKIQDENDKVKRNNAKNLHEVDSYHSAHDNNNVQEKRSADSAYGR